MHVAGYVYTYGLNPKYAEPHVCVCSYKWALVGKCVRILFPCGECVTCRRLVGIPTRNNAKSKRFRLF